MHVRNAFILAAPFAEQATSGGEMQNEEIDENEGRRCNESVRVRQMHTHSLSLQRRGLRIGERWATIKTSNHTSGSNVFPAAATRNSLGSIIYSIRLFDCWQWRVNRRRMCASHCAQLQNIRFSVDSSSLCMNTKSPPICKSFSWFNENMTRTNKKIEILFLLGRQRVDSAILKRHVMSHSYLRKSHVIPVFLFFALTKFISCGIFSSAIISSSFLFSPSHSIVFLFFVCGHVFSLFLLSRFVWSKRNRNWSNEMLHKSKSEMTRGIYIKFSSCGRLSAVFVHRLHEHWETWSSRS